MQFYITFGHICYTNIIQKRNKYITVNMNKKDLVKLKNSLPKGYRKLISKRMNCSPSLVTMVFSGTRTNLEIVKEAITIAKEHKQEMESLSKEINDIMI